MIRQKTAYLIVLSLLVLVCVFILVMDAYKTKEKQRKELLQTWKEFAEKNPTEEQLKDAIKNVPALEEETALLLLSRFPSVNSCSYVTNNIRNRYEDVQDRLVEVFLEEVDSQNIYFFDDIYKYMPFGNSKLWDRFIKLNPSYKHIKMVMRRGAFLVREQALDLFQEKVRKDQAQGVYPPMSDFIDIMELMPKYNRDLWELYSVQNHPDSELVEILWNPFLKDFHENVAIQLLNRTDNPNTLIEIIENVPSLRNVAAISIVRQGNLSTDIREKLDEYVPGWRDMQMKSTAKDLLDKMKHMSGN